MNLKDLSDVVDLLIEHDTWTREVTLNGMLPKFEEESAEVVQAVLNNDMPNLEEELGDVLFHVVTMIKKADLDFNAVVAGICQKMVTRHLSHLDIESTNKEV